MKDLVKQFLAGFLFLMMAYLDAYRFHPYSDDWPNEDSWIPGFIPDTDFRQHGKPWVWFHCFFPCCVFAWKMLIFDCVNGDRNETITKFVKLENRYSRWKYKRRLARMRRIRSK